MAIVAVTSLTSWVPLISWNCFRYSIDSIVVGTWCCTEGTWHTWLCIWIIVLSTCATCITNLVYWIPWLPWYSASYTYYSVLTTTRCGTRRTGHTRSSRGAIVLSRGTFVANLIYCIKSISWSTSTNREDSIFNSATSSLGWTWLTSSWGCIIILSWRTFVAYLVHCIKCKSWSTSTYSQSATSIFATCGWCWTWSTSCSSWIIVLSTWARIANCIDWVKSISFWTSTYC